MILKNVYESELFVETLYELLKQRGSEHSISHQTLPSFSEHMAFVKSNPYRYWYIVEVDGAKGGSVYITENNEIGLFLLPDFVQYQTDVLGLLVATHSPLPAVKSKRVAAFSVNANPSNATLISSILAAGGRHVQSTYLLD